jgi:hypothetical protein
MTIIDDKLISINNLTSIEKSLKPLELSEEQNIDVSLSN